MPKEGARGTGLCPRKALEAENRVVLKEGPRRYWSMPKKRARRRHAGRNF